MASFVDRAVVIAGGQVSYEGPIDELTDGDGDAEEMLMSLIDGRPWTPAHTHDLEEMTADSSELTPFWTTFVVGSALTEVFRLSTLVQ